MRFLLTFLFGSLIFLACNTEGDTTSQEDPATTPAAAAGAESASADKVWHYLCPNGCEAGKSNTKGACPECKAQMAHNQAFHQQPQNQQQQPAAQENPISPVMQNQPQQQQPTAPAQNAAGEWHYVCSKGCEGGSGSQGTCGTCGATLAHNSAYHQ